MRTPAGRSGSSAAWTGIATSGLVVACLAVAPGSARAAGIPRPFNPESAIFIVLAHETGDSSRVGGEIPAVPPLERGWIPLAKDSALWRADRLEHFSLAASLVLGAEVAGASDAESAGGTLSLALLKEWSDARRGRGASLVDLAFGALGIASGLLVARLAR